MSKERCKETVHDRELKDYAHRCNNKAGYGPDKAYCKIHAREHGVKFGEEVTLYRVMPKDWQGPMRIAESKAEVTEKIYRLSGNDSDFDYVRNQPKEYCANKGIFTTKQEALTHFLKQAANKVEATAMAAIQAEKDLELAEIFVREQEDI
jgi:hypothetical protein